MCLLCCWLTMVAYKAQCLYCCMFIHCCRHVFTKPLPSKGSTHSQVCGSYFYSNLFDLACVFCWLETVLWVNDYEMMLICGYPCGLGEVTIGCYIHHLQLQLTVMTFAVVLNCHRYYNSETNLNTLQTWPINTSSTIKLNQVKMHLYQQNTINVRNIFNVKSFKYAVNASECPSYLFTSITILINKNSRI